MPSSCPSARTFTTNGEGATSVATLISASNAPPGPLSRNVAVNVAVDPPATDAGTPDSVNLPAPAPSTVIPHMCRVWLPPLAIVKARATGALRAAKPKSVPAGKDGTAPLARSAPLVPRTASNVREMPSPDSASTYSLPSAVPTVSVASFSPSLCGMNVRLNSADAPAASVAGRPVTEKFAESDRSV